MNKIEIMGRMVKDIELKKGKNDNTYGVFTLAVNRKENKEITDFVDCVAFGSVFTTCRCKAIVEHYLKQTNKQIQRNKISKKYVIAKDFLSYHTIIQY